MIIEHVSVGSLEVNCYCLALREASEAVIIDPGAEPRKIMHALSRHKLKPILVVNTHGHYDHIGADDKFGSPVYAHRADVPLLEDSALNLSGMFGLPYRVKSKIIPLEDGDVIGLEGLKLKVLHIPGHTRGGIALKVVEPEERIVFTGDNLFCGGIGRTDLEGGDETLLIRTIKEKLLSLSDDTVIYPGHGPASTIGEERKHNPFLIS
ncbi:MAG: MBL fold metallo-hydrolase [Candidatus Omnitrophica bacterium]|nr:MBL fold metallo-hydrolase [Candidatus Omnitrophota bacterium]